MQPTQLKIVSNVLVITWLSMALLFTSCTKVIDFDVSDTNVHLVVDGSVTSELINHRVKLSKTASYFSNAHPPVVSGAIVKVSDGTTIWTYSELSDEPGTYQSDSVFQALPGYTYTLIIQSEGQEYQASETLQTGAQLDSFDLKQQFKPIPFENKVDSSYTLSVWGQEVPGVRNFYMWKVKLNGSFGFTDTLKNIYFLDDKGIDGAYIPGYPIYNIDKQYIHSGDTISIYGYTITENYYEYLRSILLETYWRGDSPWDGPPANIPSNLNNGALGYFWVAPLSKRTKIMD